jgi:hypothetical protein
MKHPAAKVGTLLLFVVLAPSHWSTAQTNTPDNQPSTTGVVAGIARMSNELPTLVQVTNRPLRILFKSYEGDGHNFFLQFSPGPMVFGIPAVGMEVKNRYGRTGYFIRKFEQKKTTATSPNIAEERDVSELTLQREGEEPVVLVFLQVQTVRERIAQVVCPGSAVTQTVYRSEFFFHCGESVYKVEDIKPDKMIIIDWKSGEEKTNSLCAPRQ